VPDSYRWFVLVRWIYFFVAVLHFCILILCFCAMPDAVAVSTPPAICSDIAPRRTWMDYPRFAAVVTNACAGPSRTRCPPQFRLQVVTLDYNAVRWVRCGVLHVVICVWIYVVALGWSSLLRCHVGFYVVTLHSL